MSLHIEPPDFNILSLKCVRHSEVESLVTRCKPFKKAQNMLME